MVGGKHALVVVACLFAGVGAWGASVDVAPTYTYASELFGAGHDAIEYPKDARPMVTLTIPANVLDDTATTDVDESLDNGDLHNGEAEITFTLTAGVFDANIGGLMWDPDGPAPADCDGNALGCVEASSAPGTVASILEGGRKGQNFIKIKIEAANPDTDSAALDTDVTNDGGRRNVDVMQQLMFDIPELDELTHLAGAGDTADKLKKVELMAESRIVSGAFSDGALIENAQGDPSAKPVLYSQNAVSVSISGVDEQHIAIDDSKDGSMKAFHHLLGAKKGFVKLADVTIKSATKRVIAEKVDATNPMLMYTYREPGEAPADGSADSDDGRIYTLRKPGALAKNDPILDLNGEEIDSGLRGTLTITAEGSRGLFNDGDVMFIDYDGNTTEGDSERIDLDGDMGEGSALSIDPDKSESFSGGDVLSTGMFSVYYSAGGKDQMKHESMITVTASVDYSDPSAINEGAKSSDTTLRFAGVGSPVKAYAIPHSANLIGDKGNLRVRCEEAAGDDKACRVFLECWDQMGARGFGEAPMVGENMTAVWNGAAVEGVAEGLDEPTTRISCQVLSKGMVTVQQLTRDGNSQTLVNNTYVGGGM